jgi:hypothetical protein
MFALSNIPTRRVFQFAVLLWVAVGLFTAGCRAANRARVHPVQGTVLVGGKPAAKALVTFHSESGAKTDVVLPVGEVDEHGNFTLTSYRAGDGAPEGEYRVAVVLFRAVPPRRSAEGDDLPPRNLLPEIYSRADSTPLRATVKHGRNNLEPFELKAK